MDRPALFRRTIHCLLALAPAYYLLPEELPGVGWGRWVLLIGFFLIVSMVEVVRHLMGWTFFGLRPHERDQIASFVWAAAGVTIALWLFREDVATAAIIGMALVDPLAGELRRVRPGSALSLTVPLATYFVIAVSVLHLWGAMPVTHLVLAGALGAVTAVIAERAKTRYVDDDFLMILLPCLVMQLFAL